MSKPDPSEPPTETGDTAAVKDLLLWARERGFEIPFLECGAVKIQVRDLRQGQKEALVPPPSGDIYKEHGLDIDDPPTRVAD